MNAVLALAAARKYRQLILMGRWSAPGSRGHSMGKRSWVGLVLISALLMSACGEEGDAEAEGTGTEAEGPSVLSLEEVEQATIQIVAEGSFIDPEFGAYEGSGAGSGFIIDPSGIAVTNNHVVTGSALLEVYVRGRTSRRTPRSSGCRNAPTSPSSTSMVTGSPPCRGTTATSHRV